MGSAKAKRDASTAAGFISICTQINTWVVENPYYYQISSYATTIISVTAPVFTAADLTALSVVNTALQVSVTTLTVAVTTLQSTILELTGATVSDAELDALPSCEADPDVCYPDATTVGTTATTGTTGTTGTTTTGTTGTTGTTSDVCVCTTAEGTTVTTPLEQQELRLLEQQVPQLLGRLAQRQLEQQGLRRLELLVLPPLEQPEQQLLVLPVLQLLAPQEQLALPPQVLPPLELQAQLPL